MSDNKYTSPIAQSIEATGEVLSNTPMGVLYFVITVGSLLGVLYFGVNRLETGLGEISTQLQHIDRDLQRTTDKLEESMAHVKPITVDGGYVRHEHPVSR